MRPLNATLISLILSQATWAAAPIAAPAKADAPADAKADAAGVKAAAEAAKAAPPSVMPSTEDPKFQAKLQEMLRRSDTSIKLLRNQITRNQSAPFLANLYMQLGDLLSQKSNVLYYLQMERDKGTALQVQETKRFSPVVASEQEAIAVYQQIIKEFPKFDQLDKVMYRLAVAEKAIDESAAFADTAEKLIKAFPKTKEATQARLLLGQHFFDMEDFDASLKYLNEVKDSPEPFERAAARYRIGLIEIRRERFKEALSRFEQVAMDQELSDLDNPAAVSLKAKTVKSNIKREALIDSTRAYTEVYKTGADPVGYYARVAPTETLFQETIEKLAYRYIFLKQYPAAVTLLRTLSERTADAQRIMNVYHEVLRSIPIADRIKIPVGEIQFVLEKYNYWSTHYTLSPELKKKSTEFFETQLRELATASHDVAKRESNLTRKGELLARAEDFYLLYLGYFHRDTRSVKMATNLADVYFNQGKYLDSASYYMRLFGGEFGASPNREALLQNAILALQKPAEYSFYEQLRSKGLLARSIETYQAFNPAKKKDASLSFALAKVYYEQGFYKRALGDLMGFMRTYPDSPEVESAAELILNYFNTRSDFKGLVTWSNAMLALKPKSAELGRRLASVQSKAQLKQLDEKMKSQKGYDVFAQGKSYLKSAMSASDPGMRSVAFEQALGRSKAERDIETFLKTAFTMAKSETKAAKRSDLLLSMADETLGITRFYETMKIWKRDADDGAVPAPARASAHEKMVQLAVMLHDVRLTADLLNGKAGQSLSAEIKTSARGLLSSALESPVAVPPQAVQAAVRLADGDEDWLTLFKAQPKMPSALRTQVVRQLAARCPAGAAAPVCRWLRWDAAARDLARLQADLKKQPTTIASVEPAAAKMNQQLETMKVLGGVDPQLDVLVALGSADAYAAFAGFLDRAAQANPEVAQVLKAKASETVEIANQARGQCNQVITNANLISPVNVFCQKGRLPTLTQALSWRLKAWPTPPAGDPRNPELDELQKKVFVNRKDWKPYFDLAEAYLAKRAFFHAAATSAYASTLFNQNQEEFNAVLGCAVLGLGLVGEANFHLSHASELNGHKQACMNQARAAGPAGQE